MHDYRNKEWPTGSLFCSIITFL